MTDPIQEAFTLTKADPNVSSYDGLVSATEFSTIWSYRVPDGTGLILLSGNTFSCYIRTTAADLEGINTLLLRISIMDTALQDRKGIVDAFNYGVCKEFTDRDSIFRLNVTKPYKIYEKQYLIIEATGDGTNSVDQTGGTLDSSFALNISRVRQPL